MSLPRCFGVFGHPVGHSKSPAMHGAAFDVMGLPHRYLAFDVAPDRLDAALRGAAALGFGGVNLTTPLKTLAVSMMDSMAPEAAAIGAVNTVCFEPGGMVGHNTDGAGFVESVVERVGAVPVRAVVLGGGGAARAVVHALHQHGSQVRWVSRDPRRLPSWPVDVMPYSALAGALPDADLLVNGTTVGMPGGAERFPVAVDVHMLPATALVVDLVYPAPPAGLVAQARERGLEVMDGLPMLWGQGVLALQHWIGRPLDAATRTAMWLALCK